MKINAEIEIDYIEDEEVDEYVKNKLLNEVTERVLSKLSDSMIKQIVIDLQGRIDETLTILLADFINRPINITDKWGEIQDSHASVNDLMKDKFDKFLSQAVDSNGTALKTCAVNNESTRLHYLLNRKIDERIRDTVDKAVRDTVQEVDHKIKTKFNKQFKERVAETLAGKLSINSVTDL